MAGARVERVIAALREAVGVVLAPATAAPAAGSMEAAEARSRWRREKMVMALSWDIDGRWMARTIAGAPGARQRVGQTGCCARLASRASVI
ncbi:hypothetical protein CRM94_34245 [Burkholderia gladioli]|uniref:Uncharacterized protein n=1 Tax=Burkholderia gladioli TaxID=28095 RepID=A0A2A7S7R1_BURGA|nr:hypothetical protein CO712_09365 [Burkholderia gladioli pv. gladioli]PEH39345.1 hypothetical protein CRM94_34245 [Burkholderia gladioli]PEH84539.1 hypothetical protein CRM95_05940 [Burkholderia gladioli]